MTHSFARAYHLSVKTKMAIYSIMNASLDRATARRKAAIRSTLSQTAEKVEQDTEIGFDRDEGEKRVGTAGISPHQKRG
jgi:hypothetical protein